jgi:uncharacterized membrane protein YbhN (UPF0104 family)
VLGVACAIAISSTRAAVAVAALVALALPRARLQRVRDLAEAWPTLLQALGERRLWIVPLSLVLWLAHLWQIWLFAVALHIVIPFAVTAPVAAVALMAGQLPLTVSGIGTRDVALVVLLSRYVRPESAAALGLLVTTRNLLPPLVGIPMIGPYLTAIADETRAWRRGAALTGPATQPKSVRHTAR